MSRQKPLRLSESTFKIYQSLLILFLLPLNALSQDQKYSEIYDSDKILNKGIELYQSENYSEAIQEYEKILKPDSDYLKAQYEKILALSALKKDDELVALFEKLHQDGSMTEFPDLLIMNASYHSDKENFTAAEKLFLEAEKLLPHSSIVFYNTGVLYLRMDQRQKAVDYLKKAITYNPNHASAHYILGLMAFESGKIVEGSLAMLGYLMITPAGKFSTEAVLKLNSKMGQNFLAKDNLVYSEKGDDFSELELILRNQLPLNQKYKVKTTIDDIVTRQAQAILEYAATHKIKDGYFENIYIPFLADIQNQNLSESFIYYSLISFEDKLNKKLTVHKKKIIDFSEKYINGNMWELYGKRKLEHYGSEQEVIVYLENGFPHLIGQMVNNKTHGKYKYVNKHGQLLGDLNYTDDLLDGKQTYYFLSGKKSNEIHYTKGEKTGAFKDFYNNGNLQSEGNLVKDELDGKYTYYFPNGGKQCERTYVNGKINGASICYYPNGQIKNQYHYTDGKLNGKITEYNEVGDLTQTYNYTDDTLDGEGIIYFDGTKIKSKATYQKGVVLGNFVEYYENGQLYKESVFENGNIKKFTEYHPNGKLISESFYDSKGQLEKHIYYEENGLKYFEERFKSGKTKVGYQYTKSSDQPVEVSLKKGVYEMRDLNGTLRISGNYSKGTMNGYWNYYKSNGKLNYKQHYVNDKVSGMRYDYDENENQTGIYYQDENGALSGLYEGFNNDKLSVKMYFDQGQRSGPYQYYYKNGNVSYEGYYIDGNIYLNSFTYTQSGKPLRAYKYINNFITHFKNFNADGSLASEFEFANKTEKINITDSQGLLTTTADYKNGVRNGKSVSKAKNGDLLSTIDFINDINHGKYVLYQPTGKTSVEMDYYAGLMNGTNKYYDLNGKLRLTTDEVFGKEFGKVIRYFQSGKKMYEYHSLYEVKDGEQIFYNPSGKPIAAIGYAINVIQYYKVLDATGNLGEPQKVLPTDEFEITSKYANGKNAFYLGINKGMFDKKMEIYTENGQMSYTSGFNLGKINGKRIEYYQNGKIYKSENLENGNYQDLQEYFTEDGKPLISAQYNYDEFHGEVKVFENGKLVKHKIYDSNELVEIKL